MVANLSSHKKGWDERWQEFSVQAEQGQAIIKELLFLIDEDTRSFNYIMDALGMPKKSDEEQNARKQAIRKATLYAASIPLRVMETAVRAYPLAQMMIEKGNPNSVTDAGVGVLCLHTCVMGAWMNVQVNLKGVDAGADKEEMMQKGKTLASQSATYSDTLVKLTEKVLAG
jgi:glutamate formiminotransferase/formiminotetrahydrofolate cyclodeaminase